MLAKSIYNRMDNESNNMILKRREQIEAFRFSFEGILKTLELNLWEKSEAKIWLYLNLEYLMK